VNRIESVDIFRLIAIIGVIVIHTTPFRSAPVEDSAIAFDLAMVCNQLVRFAVPFFFIISGYFWGLKLRQGEDHVSMTLTRSGRLLFLYIAWCLIYLLPLDIGAFFQWGALGPIKVSYWAIDNLMNDPVRIFFEGTRSHLWFLIGLLCALLITGLLLAINQTGLLVIISLCLYLAGVLAKSYADTPLGIDLGFNTRFGPFFSTLLFVTGYLLSAKRPEERWAMFGLAIFALGCVMHFSEIYFLWKRYGTWPEHDYVIGTYFMGLGVALAALSNHPLLRSGLLGKTGKMTLGVYVVHYLYVDIFRPVDTLTDNPLWEIAYVLIVLLLSVLTTMLLSRLQLTRKLVL
jgi:surface polysaccharide O-acyltransferase-like enzyme